MLINLKSPGFKVLGMAILVSMTILPAARTPAFVLAYFTSVNHTSFGLAVGVRGAAPRVIS